MAKIRRHKATAEQAESSPAQPHWDDNMVDCFGKLLDVTVDFTPGCSTYNVINGETFDDEEGWYWYDVTPNETRPFWMPHMMFDVTQELCGLRHLAPATACPLRSVPLSRLSGCMGADTASAAFRRTRP